MLNLIPAFLHIPNYRKPHPNTDGRNTEKHRPYTWALSPKRILTSLTHIAECATNHGLRFCTGSEFGRTMEIRFGARATPVYKTCLLLDVITPDNYACTHSGVRFN